MSHDLQDTPAELLCRFYTWLDERRYEDMVALMHPEATWERQGASLQGRQQVLDALRQRPADKRIRHVMTNAFADAHGPLHCTATAYQIVYQEPARVADQPQGPAKASKISVVTAELVAEGSAGWQIKALSSALGLDLTPAA